MGCSAVCCGTTRDKRANSKTVRHLKAVSYWLQTSALLGPASGDCSGTASRDAGSFWKVLSRLSSELANAAAAACAFQYFNFFCCLFLFRGILRLCQLPTSCSSSDPGVLKQPLQPRSICFQVTSSSIVGRGDLPSLLSQQQQLPPSFSFCFMQISFLLHNAAHDTGKFGCFEKTEEKETKNSFAKKRRLLRSTSTSTADGELTLRDFEPENLAVHGPQQTTNNLCVQRFILLPATT